MMSWKVTVLTMLAKTMEGVKTTNTICDLELSDMVTGSSGESVDPRGREIGSYRKEEKVK